MVPPDLGSRYRALRPLGRGGQGGVWLSEDGWAEGRRVAVKLLSASSQGVQLRREFALLARLGHPGLPAVHELYRTPDGLAAMVFELIEGEPLTSWWRSRSPDLVVQVVAQLLGILDFLHRRGLVHRDVKPQNVLVDEARRVHLVDFGLAVQSGTRAPAGTAGYIAPEVLAGEPATPQSDLYSVGVLLFEGIWRRLPFGEPSRMVARQLAEEAPVPEEGGTPGLRALVRQLLARQPRRRLASAADTLGLLEELEPEQVSSAAAALVSHGLPAPVLVGRSGQLATVERALDRIGDRPSTVECFLVTGQPGTGRTRLCEEIAALAGLRDVQVQRGLPLQTTGAGEAPEPAAEAARAVQRILTELRARTARGPLLVLVDDLSGRFEGGVLLALKRLSGVEEQLPLMVVATAEAAEDDLVGELDVLGLEPLDEADVAELVRSMLPFRWDSAELAARVCRLSGGNPLLAVDLTRLAVARRLEQARPLAGALDDVPAELEQRAARLTRLRVELLEPAAARLLARVALVETGLAISALAGDERPALPALLRAGVVRERDGRLELAAGTLGQLVLRHLDVDARRRLYREVEPTLDEPRGRAEGLVRAGLSAEDPLLVLGGARAARRVLDLGAAMRLYQEALRCELPAGERREALLELAGLLQATGDADGAVALLSRELEQAPRASRPALACALAEAQLRAGDVNGGLRTLEDARAEAAPGAGAERPRALRAKLLLFAGDHRQALEVAEAAAGSGGALSAEALHTAGLAHYYLGNLDRARATVERARERAVAAGDRLLEAKLDNSLAMVSQRQGDHEGARACYARCVALAGKLGHLPFEVTFRMNLGSVAQQQGDHAAALASYTRSLELAESFGGAREVAQVTHNLARLLAVLGQPERGRAHARRSLALSRRLGWRSLVGHNLILRAELAAADDPEAEGDLARAEELFEELSDVAGWAEARLARARRLLVARDDHRAADLADEVRRRTEGMTTLQLQAHLVRGRALLKDAPERARPHLRAALELAESTGEREGLVELHRALAAAAGDDVVAAAAHAASARQLLQRQLEQMPEELHQGFLALHGEGQPPDGPGRLYAASPPDGPGRLHVASLDADLLAALLEINKELATETDLKRLLERIIDHAVDLTGAERGFLLLLAEGGDGPFQIEVARNIDQETIRRKGFKISRSVAEEVLQTGKPLITVNAMDDHRFAEFLSVHNLRLRSILCAPMTIRRRVRGAVYVDNRFQVQAFTDNHAGLLAALAGQAALAIGNRELLSQLTRQQTELERSRSELERVNLQLQEAMEQQRLELAELSRLARSQRGELESRYQFDNLVGQSSVMRELFRLMDRVKDSDAPIYIHGESGTGKELVAKALHYNSPRQAGPFIGVNCGALAPSLLESELFGYERGAFTGAERLHLGLFERSHQGSLFLDEVGDMPAELQVKLLRVLQEKTFQRVGGEEDRQADFRLLAASNKDLAELVREGTFREDLYYRINVIQLRLPPLRERREDVPLLIEHLLRRHGGGDRRLSRAALGLLMEHSWPGNVRELENELLRALALGESTIRVEDLSARLAGSPSTTGPLPGVGPGTTLKEAVAELERNLATAALSRCGGNVTQAARQLGMTRVGLHKLMTRHGIRREDVP
jgi:transcriptional regulator with GAF, ATPase, and Fis domain/tetratricopeptide (TPR) repeat protein/predicted Ser/Thr protein kinase